MVTKGTNAKTGKPWTRYAITTSEGQTGSTFDDTVGKIAVEFEKSKANCYVISEKSADGKYEVTLPVRAKVLSQGTLTAALKISAGAFSAVAKEKITKTGGQVLESA